MRSLHVDLTAAQKGVNIKALVKIQLTQGANDYTYTQTRIKRISHSEEPYSQTADVVLDNADGTLTSIDFTGYKGVISWGMTDGNTVDRFSACAPLWVIGSQLVSMEGVLVLRLSLAGIPNRLGEDRASEAFFLGSDDNQTLKDLLTQVLKGLLPLWAASTAYSLDALVVSQDTNGYVYKCTTAGTTAASAPTWPTTIGNTVADNTVVWTCQGRVINVYDHANWWTPSFDSEDTLLDSFQPKESFSIGLNESRLSVVKWLLNWTKCSIRAQDDGQPHILQPTVSGTTYDYEYSLAAGEHTFFNKTYRNRLIIPNSIVVVDVDGESSGYRGLAEDSNSASLLKVQEYHYLALGSAAQADAIAAAILQKYSLEAEKGSGLVPVNVGQEVYDYVKITDSRENDNRVGNILLLNREYWVGRWTMELRFGPRTGARLMSTLLPSVRGIGRDTGGGAGQGGDLEAIEALLNELVVQVNELLAAQWATIINILESEVRPRLHVTDRLRIPVGADQFDNTWGGV